ncbi:MAG: hypothetical protein M4579_002057 [Chaenotheca gracillima]|nr:MAG: hypothetical protein M4579_002057 [Chaenotheca gracillima]
MAHFLRGKQAGVQNDLSAGIIPELFALDQISRYGVNSQISTIAYDPVQSLLAVGTNESPYGGGQIYVFGQRRVCVTLELPRKASVKSIQFCAEKLVCLDSKNQMIIYSLFSKKRLATYTAPGFVNVLLTDPSLDFALLGLQNGDTIAYDLDREALAPFKIPNLWRERNPKARMLPVVSLALHPRDIGTLLIGYSEGAALFSFKQNKATNLFQYELPPGAPGGDSDPSSINSVRRPRLTQALWHPTGTFILTGHEDSSMVFWDPRDGRVIMARTLQDTNVDKPGAGSGSFGRTPGTFSLKEPLFKISWCAKPNPEDTGILIAGGAPTTLPTKGLTFFELGETPNYTTSTWAALSHYLESPRRQRILPTPAQAEVVDFCVIPRSSPHFAGANDPIAVISLLSSGELVTLSFPNGHPISPTNQLHLSLSFVHPFINQISFAPIERTRWLGMRESRQQGPQILTGGAESTHPLKRHVNRNILQTAHADGSIRLWDAGHADEIENPDVLQVDIARTMGRFDNIQITQISMSGATGELAVGLQTGETAVFKWGRNRRPGYDSMQDGNENPIGLVDVTGRTDPSLKEGMVPFTMLNMQHGPVTAVKMSEVGFVGIGYESGSIAIIDLRGPAIIHESSFSELGNVNRRGSIRKSSGHRQPNLKEWAVAIEFAVMSIDNDDYSSICMFVGTKTGRIATFKLLPQPNGGFAARLVGSTTLDDRIIRLAPLNAESGKPASATPTAVSGLRDGIRTNGVLLAVTPNGARIFKPTSSKGAHKTWDEFLCDSAAVVENEGRGHVLVGVFGDGFTRAFSLPGLKEIGAIKISHLLDVRRLGESVISEYGDIFGWIGPSEIAVLNVWGAGQEFPQSNDQLFNPQLTVPPRPTISNMQWIAGTQYVSPADMDLLIGGPDRPPSRRMIEQERLQQRQQMQSSSSGSRAPPGSAAQAAETEEGYWAYMQRQLNERTEKLGIMGDSMDHLQETSSGWANDVSKFVGQQKRKAVLGALGSKFGL